METAIPNQTKKSRCPACNPMHGGSNKGGMRTKNAHTGLYDNCVLCGGEKKVDVEVSRRYVEAINKETW